MAYVNLLETDLLVEFATLLGEFQKDKAEEFKKLAEAKTGGLELIENGLIPSMPEIAKSKALDAATVMSFAVISKLEEAGDKEKAVTMVKDAILKEEKEIEPQHTLSMLTALFNELPADSNTRFTLFMALAARAQGADVARWLVDSDVLKRVDSFKTDWKLSSKQYSEMLLALLSLCESTQKKETFGELLVNYLESLDQDTSLDEKEVASSVENAKEWATATIKETFTAPFVMANRMRTLKSLNSVQQLRTGDLLPMLELLDCYVDEDINAYLKFAETKANLDYMQKNGISHVANINNFRVFAACKLPLGEYTYPAIQKALRVEKEEDIESAIIGLVLSNKVDAKIDQAQGRIHIRHTAQRELKDAQWSELGTQLRGWKEGVKNVLSSLYKARQL